jgi:hypothetical protein
MGKGWGVWHFADIGARVTCLGLKTASFSGMRLQMKMSAAKSLLVHPLKTNSINYQNNT